VGCSERRKGAMKPKNIRISISEGFSLKGRIAIVTGGAGLIGPHFVEALVEAGARVAILDLDEEKSKQVASQIVRRLKLPVSRIVCYRADVTVRKDVETAVAAIIHRWKHIDILVNAVMAVGPNFYDSLESYTEETWNLVMRCNVWGPFLCMQIVSRYMKKRREGVIVNIGSMYGMVAADQRIYGDTGINSPASYAASKAAMIQLTRYAGVYFAPYGIRVNAISPGGIYKGHKTSFLKEYANRTPSGRMVNPQELKGALIYLVSPSASSVTGHNLVVDGGWTAW